MGAKIVTFEKIDNFRQKIFIILLSYFLCFMILAWKLLLFVFRIKQFDRIIGDWKRKADGLSQELDASQKECRNVSSELFRVRSGYEEASVQLADVKRENATLGDEIKDIMEQISEGNS